MFANIYTWFPSLSMTGEGRGQWPLLRWPQQVQGHIPWPWNCINNPQKLLYLSGWHWFKFSMRESYQTYPWKSRMYSHNYHTVNSVGDGHNCIHTYTRMLTFCATAIIYYNIINSSYAFIKSTNMIYHNCVCHGDVYYINQMCQWHILILKPLKCL